MFIIESTAPRTIGFGTKLYIQPMINKVDAKLWEELKKSGYARAIKAMEDEGTLIIKKQAKLTSAIVKKTYDIKLLEEWSKTAKGAVLKTVKTQLQEQYDMIEEQKKKAGF